jgi:anti-sigma-K factor RskA
MNDQPSHDMLDDVAVYALGTLPPAEAARVRAHLATCAECQAEYAALAPAAALVGISAETQGDAVNSPSTLLKPRIMRQIRASAAPAAPGQDRRAPARTPVWPAYLVAAACFAFALISSIANISLSGQLRDVRLQLASISERSSSLASNLDEERSTLSDMMSADSKHYEGNDGEVVTHGSRLYLAMHDLPPPPRGKVYQTWTLPKGTQKMAPSLTFVPDKRGVAILSIPVDARATGVVAVSIEPEGGSKQPTTKPVLVVPLT